MTARILSIMIFWILMTVLILGALVVVLGLYLPFVALKAIYLALTGRLADATGDRTGMSDDPDTVRPHIG